VKVWHQKWNALKYENDKDVSEYAIRFKRIYKRVDSYKSTLSRIIVRKFINSLPSKYVEVLTIIGLANLDETIEAVLDVEVSQKVKVRKRD